MPSPATQKDNLQAELESDLARSVDPRGIPTGDRDVHPALAWAASGAMALTGHADGPPRLAPAALAVSCRRAAGALHQMSGTRATAELDGAQFLGERAAIAGLRRAGDRSPGGTCRILPAADGWIAVNLARSDDHSLLPAWLGSGCGSDPWPALADRVREQPRDPLVARARLLGLPVAPLAEPPKTAPRWCRVAARGSMAPNSRKESPRVLDLSALWAGPLCAHLLGLAGAHVIKVESLQRPDGARFGPEAFFHLMNAGKQSVALDLHSRDGRGALRRLIQSADIVIESARPRALAQLGIDAASLVRQTPGLTWLSITGYGRDEPAGGWVAFGDDAAAAAGLALAMDPAAPIFCGDAIADPLTGLHAAVACLKAWQQGGGVLLDVALSKVVAHVLASAPSPPARVERTPGSSQGWTVVAATKRETVRAPRARHVHQHARPLGSDTEGILREVANAC